MNEFETSGAELRCRSPSLSQDHLFSRQGLPPGKLIPHIIIGYRPLTIYDLNTPQLLWSLAIPIILINKTNWKAKRKMQKFSLLN